MPPRGPRRTPGLRRDEVAQLAGVSVEYVIRLEQGRAGHPSRQVLDALARALRLKPAERDHLLRLAGAMPEAGAAVPQHVPPSVRRLVERLDDLPVAVFDAAWTLLSYNRLWAALLGEQPADRGYAGNLLWRLFTTPAASGPVLRTPEERETFLASAVADLRLAAGRYPHDDRLRQLIVDLRGSSTDFARLWSEHAVAPYVSDRKTVAHPELGLLTLDCDVLTVTGSDLRIVVYTAAPGTPEADALTLLAVVGTHRLSGAPPPA